MNSVPLKDFLWYFFTFLNPQGLLNLKHNLPLSIQLKLIQVCLQLCVHDLVWLQSICQWHATSPRVCVHLLQAAVCCPVSMCCVQPKPTARRARTLQVHCGGRTEKQPNGIFHSLSVGDIFMDGVCVDFYSSSLTEESWRVMAVKGGWRGRRRRNNMGKKQKEEDLNSKDTKPRESESIGQLQR